MNTQATQVLMDEHQGIKRMLAAMERSIPALKAGDATPLPLFVQGIDFLRNFADRCHHHKEEKVLFPKLVEKGVPVEGGPIGVMLREHDEGRAYIRAMDEAIRLHEAGEVKALQDLATAAQGYIQMLRAHIDKEDNVLFQMANRALSPDEQNTMAEEFDRIETEVIGVGTHERYHRMLDSLETE